MLDSYGALWLLGGDWNAMLVDLDGESDIWS